MKIFGYFLFSIQLLILAYWYYVGFISDEFHSHVDDIMRFGALNVVAIFNSIFLLVFWWKRKELKKIIIWRIIYLFGVLIIIWVLVGWIKIFITEGF